MYFNPIAKALTANHLKNIHLIATDMDGTLTQQGKITSTVCQALETLAQAGISVLIITGRSAGWVDAVKSYLPVTGAIAENGGLFYSNHREDLEILTPIPDLKLHRQQLRETFQFLKSKFPQIQETVDNRFRITDFTFSVKGLKSLELQELAHLCQEKGWGFTHSTVHCHIKLLEQDKASSLIQVLKEHFPQFTREQIITVGDSPNDESLFDASKFSLSVGVANILHYTENLNHKPAYITTFAEAEGFCQLAELVIKSNVELIIES
ncbi:MAG: HAD family phosphatase [Moorea sp. SIO2B7]|nr:HAD family phosphatase [Moorena sp. SIO2B7]